MGLSDRQIERYSRQIIVIGGFAQERLLESRVAIVGDARDAEATAYYLAGAGIGHIDLILSGEVSLVEEIVMRARGLNSEVSVALGEGIETVPELTVAFIRSGPKQAESRAGASTRLIKAPAIVVKAESPAKLALIADLSLCMECVVENLLALPVTGGKNKSFIASFASVEALKMLFSDKSPQQSRLIEFDGYSTHSSNPTFLRGALESSCDHQRSNPSPQ